MFILFYPIGMAPMQSQFNMFWLKAIGNTRRVAKAKGERHTHTHNAMRLYVLGCDWVIYVYE